MKDFEINDETIISELKHLLIQSAGEKDLANEKILELQQLLTQSAKEKDLANNKIQEITNALAEIFPFDLYATFQGSDNCETIREFEQILQSPSLSEKLQLKKLALLSKEKSDNYLAKENAIQNFKTLYTSLYINNAKNKRILSFSKTIGSTQPIDQNKDHLFAKRHTTIHLKSNSICTWIPKIGCSNIRYSIAKANGAISDSEDIAWIHTNNESFCADNKELLKADYTYVILRNPFKRLLSFFLDKMCHNDPNEIDKSYSVAQKKYNASSFSSFEDLVKLLWANPKLINEDHHIKPQHNFLIYNKYDNYFCLENYNYAIETIYEKTGIEIIDTRNIGSVHTTLNLVESSEVNYSTASSKINNFLRDGKKPLPTNMYSKEMCQMVGTLYMTDIMIYLKTVKNADDEMRYWMTQMTHF